MNHGRCQSMAYFASVQDAGEGTVYAYGGGMWDADMMYGCNCDTGYSGPMCNLRDCAVGDDPLTGTEEVRAIELWYTESPPEKREEREQKLLKPIN